MRVILEMALCAVISTFGVSAGSTHNTTIYGDMTVDTAAMGNAFLEVNSHGVTAFRCLLSDPAMIAGGDRLLPFSFALRRQHVANAVEVHEIYQVRLQC